MATTLPPEPPTDFGRPEAREAWGEALARADEAMGVLRPAVVDGERWRLPEVFDLPEPGDPEAVTASFCRPDAEVAKQALEAAADAAPSWAATPWADRAHLLLEAAERLRRERASHGAWLVRVCGAPWPVADREVASAAHACERAALEAMRRARGPGAAGSDAPLGAGVLVTGLASPLGGPAAALASALAAGCTVAWAPEELACAAAWPLFSLLEEVGAPRGVVNFLPGPPPEAVEAALRHPEARFAALAGLRATVDRLDAAAAAREGGAPRRLAHRTAAGIAVVDETADLEEAAAAVARAAFEFAGQGDQACRTALVDPRVHDAFCDRVTACAQALEAGAPTRASVVVGPLASRARRDAVLAQCEAARAAGARVAGGAAEGEGSWVVAPAVIADLPDPVGAAGEHALGPVLVVRRCALDEALSAVAALPPGAWSGVWTRDPRHAEAARRARGTSPSRPLGAWTSSDPVGPDDLDLFLAGR